MVDEKREDTILILYLLGWRQSDQAPAGLVPAVDTEVADTGMSHH